LTKIEFQKSGHIRQKIVLSDVTQFDKDCDNIEFDVFVFMTCDV